MHALTRAVLVTLGLACASGCGGGGDAPPPPATFSAIYPMLFPAETKAKCNMCHSMPASDISNGRLHLGTDKATAYAALVGQTAMGKLCSGRPLVVPGDPDGSLLMQKFADTPPCGDRMPQGGGPLPVDQIDQVRRWIADGAKDD